eukprot:02222.XXX_33398_32995_1 [CDS] Oithona nana genome sequencing.
MRLVIDLRDHFPWLQRPNEPRNVGFCLCAYHCVLLIVEFLIDLGKIGIVCNSFNKVDGYFPQFDVLLTVILLNVIFNVIRQVLTYFIGDLFKILMDKCRLLMLDLDATLDALLNEM